MNSTSESGCKISTFLSYTNLLMCLFHLEKSFSFCMAGFVTANITILPKGRAWNSHLNFSCEHGQLAACTASSMLRCHPKGSALLHGERWQPRSTCMRHKVELQVVPEALRVTELVEAACSWKKGAGLLLLLSAPSHCPFCTAIASSDILLCPFTYWNGKPTHCLCSDGSPMRGIPSRDSGGNFGQELGWEPPLFGSSELSRWLTPRYETLTQDSCKRRNSRNGNLERRRQSSFFHLSMTFPMRQPTLRNWWEEESRKNNSNGHRCLNKLKHEDKEADQSPVCPL